MGSHKKKHHKEKKHKKDKKKKKSKKRRHRSSSSDSSPASKPTKIKKTVRDSDVNQAANSSEKKTEDEGLYEVPLPPGFKIADDAPQPTRLPLTKEQYEAKAKQIRKVLDPLTGRHRLVRGDGEIIEEVVSRDRHKQINQLATKKDGESFQNILHASLR